MPLPHHWNVRNSQPRILDEPPHKRGDYPKTVIPDVGIAILLWGEQDRQLSIGKNLVDRAAEWNPLYVRIILKAPLTGALLACVSVRMVQDTFDQRTDSIPPSLQRDTWSWTSPLDNLSGGGRPLRKMSPNAKEFAGSSP